MPWKPKKPCKIPNCPNLTDGTYCDYHKRIMDREYRQKRDPAINRRYNNAEWRKIRESVLSENPFCVICRKEGRLVKAEMVHHIKALSEGGDNSPENLVPLCKGCHAKLHGQECNHLSRNKVYTY